MNAPAKIEMEPLNTVEIEQAILGALMQHNDLWSKCAQSLTQEDFSEHLHRILYANIGDLISRGQAATPVTLLPFLPQVDMGAITLPQYLAGVYNEASSRFDFPHHVRLLLDCVGRREMDSLVADFVATGGTRDLRRSASELAGDLLTGLRTIMSRGAESETAVSASDGAASVIDRAREIREGKTRTLATPTGFIDLDRATGGYEAGTLWVVAARPGMGKSAFAVASGRKCAKSGDGVIIESLEIPREQMMARLLADMAYSPRRPIPFGNIYRGVDLTDEDLWVLEDCEKRLRDMPMIFDFPSKPTLGAIAAKARAERERWARRGIRLGVLFIDYLKFIKASDRYRGNRVYEVGEITAGLKTLARDEGICVVLLAQLNRANEARDDKRPTLADLRESGDIEADADVVAFVHRDAYYIEKSPEYRDGEDSAKLRFDEAKNRADIILGKNRSGPTKTVPLWCDIGSSTFANVAQDTGGMFQ